MKTITNTYISRNVIHFWRWVVVFNSHVYCFSFSNGSDGVSHLLSFHNYSVTYSFLFKSLSFNFFTFFATFLRFVIRRLNSNLEQSCRLRLPLCVCVCVYVCFLYILFLFFLRFSLQRIVFYYPRTACNERARLFL